MTRIVFGVPALLAWQWTETQQGFKRFRQRGEAPKR
jgi:hypothetical protein